MHELIKWKFLTGLSGVPARFHIFYEPTVSRQLPVRFEIWY